MSEALMDNPAITGPRDADGDAYVFFLTNGPAELAVCHGCALTAFAAGDAVTLGGTFGFGDPAECESCGGPIDDAYRESLDAIDWVDALQDFLDDIARGHQTLQQQRDEAEASCQDRSTQGGTPCNALCDACRNEPRRSAAIYAR